MNSPIPGGFLVAVEGIDGAGKTTVARHLAAWCASRGLAATESKEPTDGPWGRKLRASAIGGRLGLAEELEFFQRDRVEHVATLVRPALDAGRVVILDRYYFSNAAYQAVRGGDAAAILADNERFAPKPQLVLLLDCSPDASLPRVRARGDVPNEFERAEALAQVRAVFCSLRRPEIVRVDACQSADAVARQCVAAFSAALCARRGVCLSAAPVGNGAT